MSFSKKISQLTRGQWLFGGAIIVFLFQLLFFIVTTPRLWAPIPIYFLILLDWNRNPFGITVLPLAYLFFTFFASKTYYFGKIVIGLTLILIILNVLYLFQYFEGVFLLLVLDKDFMTYRVLYLFIVTGFNSLILGGALKFSFQSLKIQDERYSFIACFLIKSSRNL